MTTELVALWLAFGTLGSIALLGTLARPAAVHVAARFQSPRSM